MKNIRNYFSINLIIAFAVVISSFFIEHYLGFVPCKICLIQRYAWILFLIILLFCFFFLKNYKILKITLVFLNLIFISLLSIYHSGIEFGYFTNIFNCSIKTGFDATSIEELDKIISSTENQDCSFTKFRYLGLSLANIGFLLSIQLLIFNLIVFKNELFKKI